MTDVSTTKKRGPKATGKVKVTIKLLQGHIDWLEDLVNQLRFGTSRESIIECWVVKNLDEHFKAGDLRRPPGSVPESGIVAFQKEKENTLSNTDNHANQQQKP